MLLDGFVSFLLSSDNAAIKDEADQDMQRPLSEYFISSSHNVRPGPAEWRNEGCHHPDNLVGRHTSSALNFKVKAA